MQWIGSIVLAASFGDWMLAAVYERQEIGHREKTPLCSPIHLYNAVQKTFAHNVIHMKAKKSAETSMKRTETGLEAADDVFRRMHICAKPLVLTCSCHLFKAVRTTPHEPQTIIQ